MRSFFVVAPEPVFRDPAGGGWRAAGEFAQHHWMDKALVPKDQVDQDVVALSEVTHPDGRIDQHAH